MMNTNYSTTNGYIDVKLGEGVKKAHFGMNFIKILHEMGTDIHTIGVEMTSAEPIVKMTALGKLLYCGFTAYDQEMGIYVDYTPELVLEWSTLLDDTQEEDFVKVVTYATSLNNGLQRMGKQKQAN